ncbi:MAG: type ISP restriction/modification enzyme [Pyrinomonadaceae bacterium]
MTISEYISKIAGKYASGIATEHSFRGDLETLLHSLVPDIQATNEPKRIKCGAPDYVVTHKDIPVGYIEAKDIGIDLGGLGIKEQRDRYAKSLENLIFTDYLEFRLYRNGEKRLTIRIAEVVNGKVVAIPENFDRFVQIIAEFCSYRGQTITSSKQLAEMMADKAKLLAYVIGRALTSDEESEANSELKSQMKAFRQVLIHDLDAKAFADVYAQTIAYGLFAARLHDPTLSTFSRREAAELIPRTNPFLRKLFGNIATDLDERIEWIVDALADIFRAANIKAILKTFGRSTRTHDPIIHFYETFLAEYDPKLRKSRGVYYTPEPVVDFIVRAVDDILKTEFGLPDGLADTSKTKIKVKTQVRDERTKSGWKEEEKEVHKVQILDPATGTGTFLAQVIKQIHKNFEGQQGIWSQYVDQHLIPRLNGFEILMASYAMAHLKLDLLLNETGYNSSGSPPVLGGVAAASADGVVGARGGSSSSASSQRFRIYLTNALEEYHPDTGTLWASWLSDEANQANHIKRDTPVMVVLGNPPYSGESANKGKWIMDLMDDYKKEPGGKLKLKERNPKWINDDYVKFIRFGQQIVEKNGEGILAFINPHGFLDNPTFRGMRWSLLKTFDVIYTIDLHGNSTKKETSPDGGLDENVFDIKQGVSINLFVKSNRKNEKKLGRFFHYHCFGKRPAKYSYLIENDLNSVPFVELTEDLVELSKLTNAHYMIPLDLSSAEEFFAFAGIDEIFSESNMGITSGDDAKRIKFSVAELLQNGFERGNIRSMSYRPFDSQFINYDTELLARARSEFMKNFDDASNLGFATIRRSRSGEFTTPFLTRNLVDKSILSSLDNANIYPLYFYSNGSAQQTLESRAERVPNLNSEIVDEIAAAIGLTFVAEKDHLAERKSYAFPADDPNDPSGSAAGRRHSLEDVKESDGEAQLRRSATRQAAKNSDPARQAFDADATFAPIDILDYIYAALHSPKYREKYKEFLKIDFPRVPYPKNAEIFWALVKLGGELRGLHLLESPVVNKPITKFPVGGDNIVGKLAFRSEPGAVATGFRDGGAESENHPVGETPPPLLRKEGSLGRVYFNNTQYFENVPEAAWNFYIGGYQPAQKWLKDRKGRQLSYDDIQHYQKIIVALTETDRIMKDIDAIDFID